MTILQSSKWLLLKNMNNLIIGSEGFIGKALSSYLLKKGEQVTHFDVRRNELEDARNVTYNFVGIDRVYVLAWNVGGSKYLYEEKHQCKQLRWNIELLSNTLPQLQRSGIPFVFVSSQLAEEVDTVYGVTKRLGEVWVNQAERGACLRLWNVYGTLEEVSERSHVISDFITQAIKYGEIKMLTSGEEVRQFIYIEDVCKALHIAITQNIQDIYDVTSFEWIKVMEVARIIARLTNAKIVPGKDIGRTPRTPITGKMPRWNAQVSIEEGLKNMISKGINTK